MRIAEASEATGVAPRLLRYYEEQGLLHPPRSASGQRDYRPCDLTAARHVRQLLDAGLGTATIAVILPCLVEVEGQLTPVCSDLRAQLRAEERRLSATIAALSESRAAIERVIAAAPSS